VLLDRVIPTDRSIRLRLDISELHLVANEGRNVLVDPGLDIEGDEIVDGGFQLGGVGGGVFNSEVDGIDHHLDGFDGIFEAFGLVADLCESDNDRNRLARHFVWD